MIERFLRYSLERNRPIRLIFLTEEKALRQVTAVAEALEGGRVSLYILRPPQRLTIPVADILSADYTPKDEGQ